MQGTPLTAIGAMIYFQVPKNDKEVARKNAFGRVYVQIAEFDTSTYFPITPNEFIEIALRVILKIQNLACCH